MDGQGQGHDLPEPPVELLCRQTVSRVTTNQLSCRQRPLTSPPDSTRVTTNLFRSSRFNSSVNEPHAFQLVQHVSPDGSHNVCRLNNVRLDNLRSTSVGSTTFVNSTTSVDSTSVDLTSVDSITSVDLTTFVDLTTDSDFDVQIVKRIPASCCDNTRRTLSLTSN